MSWIIDIDKLMVENNIGFQALYLDPQIMKRVCETTPSLPKQENSRNGQKNKNLSSPQKVGQTFISSANLRRAFNSC